MANKANIWVGIATAIGAIVGGGLALGGKIATKKDEADDTADAYLAEVDASNDEDDEEEDTDAD